MLSPVDTVVDGQCRDKMNTVHLDIEKATQQSCRGTQQLA
ncbi:hypothetical protein UPM260_1761 [Salmonella enterica subsp. enterica serovar Typhimurium]|nr:hypothetical protein UPM260_1761 [Salmonella enterica subsp. enterica serovar Typhimurium]